MASGFKYPPPNVAGKSLIIPGNWPVNNEYNHGFLTPQKLGYIPCNYGYKDTYITIAGTAPSSMSLVSINQPSDWENGRNPKSSWQLSWMIVQHLCCWIILCSCFDSISIPLVMETCFFRLIGFVPKYYIWYTQKNTVYHQFTFRMAIPEVKPAMFGHTRILF